MSRKGLSNGTLSLRFMQNAQRAKLQAQIEAEQVKIGDDAEWSISQDLKDAWGIGGSSTKQEDVVHESSYLPFIFQSDIGEGSSSGLQAEMRPKLRGRRTFNARGLEVAAEEDHPEDKQIKEAEEGALAELDEKPPRTHERVPRSISGFKVPISTRKDGRKARTKTVQMLVHEDVSVRPPASSQPLEAVPIPRTAAFVKPAGVDDPRRADSDGRKRDRDHVSGPDRSGLEGTKRNKWKETGPIS